MSKPHRDVESSNTHAPMLATIQIPAGAVTVASPPALIGPASAAYLGMTEVLARRTLDDMRRDPAYATCVVVLSRRPCRLAAAPGDVLRFLRERRSCCLPTVAAIAHDDAIEKDLRGLGFGGTPRKRGRQ